MTEKEVFSKNHRSTHQHFREKSDEDADLAENSNEQTVKLESNDSFVSGTHMQMQWMQLLFTKLAEMDVKLLKLAEIDAKLLKLAEIDTKLTKVMSDNDNDNSALTIKQERDKIED